jgi:hypothetical protein
MTFTINYNFKSIKTNALKCYRIPLLLSFTAVMKITFKISDTFAISSKVNVIYNGFIKIV